MTQAEAETRCRHCRNEIVWGLYWVGANPEWLWYHPPGNRTCLTKPDGWAGSTAWPAAEPEIPQEDRFVSHLEEFMDEHDAALRQMEDR